MAINVIFRLATVTLILQHFNIYTSANIDGFFKVAVYDQAENVQIPADVEPGSDISRGMALNLLTAQLDIYEELAGNASLQGVKMIVFPEYGLMPSGLSKRRAYNFTETIPDPRTTPDYNPCAQQQQQYFNTSGTEVQRRLSCIASENSIYVTVNMGEVVPCNPVEDQRCLAADGRYQYNTNVVFNPTGVLVARYRKYNLFMGEPSYDEPATVDYSYFDTEFGRFGAIVCFDIIFKEPPVTLIETFSIDHVLFPTGWMNQLPYYSAVTFHQAFAIGLGVNFLAANLHNIPGNFCGSGIYGSDQTYAFRHDELDLSSRLIISEIPAKPRRIASRHPVGRSYDNVRGSGDFSGPLFDDMFNFVMVEGTSGHVSVCHNLLCCLLDYNRTSGSEPFALGAFRGLHTHEGQYYLEICTLVKCRVTEETRCAGDSKTSSTYFQFLNLTGNFTTKYVYPMVVTDGIDPSSGDWAYTGLEVIVSNSTRKPLVSSTLYGRRFDLDDGEKEAAKGVVSSRSTLLLLLLPLLVSLLLNTRLHAFEFLKNLNTL